MRIAVAGANGFVGSAICRALAGAGLDFMPLTRGVEPLMPVDVFINAACPARRFWAEQNPLGDFTETVTKTATMLCRNDFKRFIQISSISARTQASTVYGLHRLLGEMVVGRDPRSVAVRLGPMYGHGLTKGALFDVIEDREVFVPRDTRYGYVDVAWCGQRIVELVTAVSVPPLVELGARNWITISELAAGVGSRCRFTTSESKVPDDQYILEPDPTAPDAHDVVAWARLQKRFK